MCREMEILLRQPLSRRHCLDHCNQALHSGKAHQCKAHQRIISQLPIVATKTRRSNIMHQPKAGCTASLVYLGTFGHDRSIYIQIQATKFAPKRPKPVGEKINQPVMESNVCQISLSSHQFALGQRLLNFTYSQGNQRIANNQRY